MERSGERAGYLFSYFMFTTMLYFLLIFLKKLPGDWSYLSVAFFTFCITLTGEAVKRMLK